MSQHARGPLFIDLEGPEMSQEEREILAHPLVGGVVLFTRNFFDRAQLSALCQTIKRAHGRDLVICVDHEGGRVQRFREHGFTELPAAALFGREYARDPEAAMRLAGRVGWLLGHELKAVGVDVSFAPVIDCAHPRSTVLGDRTFDVAPGVIAALAGRVLEGMHAAGVVGCIKHFPGHGGVSEDSHTSLPEDPRAMSALEARDLIPFRLLSRAEAVMTAHVRFPAIDPDIPCFSRFWIVDILRRRLGFDGVVVSDDLTMAGAAAIEPRAEDRVARALAAGCDIVLMLNDRAGVVAALDGVRGVAPVQDQRWRRWGSPLGRAAEMADFEDFGAISVDAVVREIDALKAAFAEDGEQA